MVGRHFRRGADFLLSDAGVAKSECGDELRAGFQPGGWTSGIHICSNPGQRKLPVARRDWSSNAAVKHAQPDDRCMEPGDAAATKSDNIVADQLCRQSRNPQHVRLLQPGESEPANHCGLRSVQSNAGTGVHDERSAPILQRSGTAVFESRLRPSVRMDAGSSVTTPTRPPRAITRCK